MTGRECKSFPDKFRDLTRFLNIEFVIAPDSMKGLKNSVKNLGTTPSKKS